MARTAIPSMATASFFFFFLLLLDSHHLAVVDARETFACDPKDPNTANQLFCRTSLPFPERVQDLLGRLTLPEKAKLLVNGAAAVPRLGIKGYEWWSEALHGVSNVGPGTRFGGEFPGATSFPQVITTAASFNASLWEAIGQVIVHSIQWRSPFYCYFFNPSCKTIYINLEYFTKIYFIS